MKRRKKLTEKELRYLSKAILNEKRKKEIDPQFSQLLYAYVGELNNLRKTIDGLTKWVNYDFRNINNAVMTELPKAEDLFNYFIRR